MPTTPASIAAAAEPVILPQRIEMAKTPSATTVGRSPPNSTTFRTRVAAIPVSAIKRAEPGTEQDGRSWWAAGAPGPVWSTACATLVLAAERQVRRRTARSDGHQHQRERRRSTGSASGPRLPP